MRPNSVATHTSGAAASARAPKSGERAPHHDREQRRKEREVGDERAVENRGDPHRQTTVDTHHQRDPVQRAREVNHPGGQAEQECVTRAGGTGERHQERRERDPAEGGMSELRETERQKDAGRER